MYIGYIQFLLIIFVFINSLDNNPVSQFVLEEPLIAVPLILALFVLCSLILGYMDSKLGFREEEIRNHSRSNPVLRKLQTSLDELNSKVDKLENDQRRNGSDKI
jgi:Tfp pilus assembly protein PilN